MPAVVILERQGDGSLLGVVETTASMTSDAKNVRIWFSSTYTGTFIGTFDICGPDDARAFVERSRNPDRFEIYNVEDADLPIEIDWAAWDDAQKPANTLSGVRCKYKARNAPFRLREK